MVAHDPGPDLARLALLLGNFYFRNLFVVHVLLLFMLQFPFKLTVAQRAELVFPAEIAMMRADGKRRGNSDVWQPEPLQGAAH